jgi:hypothetical protein
MTTIADDQQRSTGRVTDNNRKTTATNNTQTDYYSLSTDDD